MDDKRNRVWKRLRFWGSIFLIVVVGIGILAYVTYRKALVPPPTPPGKSPEFDQHLADIDKDWLFVFQDGKRLILCDIYGNDIIALPEIEPSWRRNLHLEWVEGRMSPDGRRVTISYEQEEVWDINVALQGAMVADLIEKTSQVLIDPWDYVGEWSHEDVQWLESNVVFVGTWPTECLEKGIGRVPTYGSYSLFYLDDRLRIDYFEKPEWPGEVEISTQEWLGELGFSTQRLGRETPSPSDFRTLQGPEVDAEEIWVPFLGTDPLSSVLGEVVHESHRLPEDTLREMAGLAEQVRSRRGMVAVSPFPIEVREATRTGLVRKILRRFGVKNRFRNEIRQNSRRVRLTREDIVWSGGRYILRSTARVEAGQKATVAESLPVWIGDLRLFLWQEDDGSEFLPVYIMDEKGHYRFWHRGIYWGRVPRRPLEKQVTEK